MICKNCGTEISDIEKFCGKCGTPVVKTENTSFQPQVKNLKSYKKISIFVLAVVLVIGVVSFIFTNSNKLEGHWEISEKSESEKNLSNYPEDNFIIFDNGTFTADDVSGTYSTNGKTITMNVYFFGSITYEYDVYGDTLMLQLTGENPIYYDRVG